jgi:hypothetical protein
VSAYLERLGQRILCHRYRYYVQAKPVIEDYEYDWLEKHYERLCAEQGVPAVTANLVGFDPSRPDCAEAARLVDAGEDDYSVWAREQEATERRIMEGKRKRKARTSEPSR